MRTLAHPALPRYSLDLRIKRLFDRVPLLRVLLLLLLLCLSAASGKCEEIFMLISGIPGESTAPGHSGWIEVSSMNHGLSAISSTNANHADVYFIKRVDSTSPLLYDRMNRGTVIPDVQIDFTRSSPSSVQFYKINLTGVQVTSANASAGRGGDGITESVSLFYKQIAWSYTQVDAPGMPIFTATWNRNDNKGTYSTDAADSDGDGMPDAYELANRLDPSVNDANDDPDHDGLTNYQEFLAGTNPRDTNSVFRVTRINLASGQVRITWNSVAGKTYTISAASDVNGSYIPVRNVPSAGTGETSTDFSPSLARQFYRVSTP